MEPNNSQTSNIIDSDRFFDEIKFKTPRDKRTNKSSSSPDFSPYNYSSPMKSNRINNMRGRNNRYFSMSDSNYNSKGNYNNSNFYSRNRRGNHNYCGGRGGNQKRYSDSAPISLYVNSSMVDDPWFQLEQELERSRSQELDKSQEIESSFKTDRHLNSSDPDYEPFTTS